VRCRWLQVEVACKGLAGVKRGRISVEVTPLAEPNSAVWGTVEIEPVTGKPEGTPPGPREVK
jgi:hypothetical protein